MHPVLVYEYIYSTLEELRVNLRIHNHSYRAELSSMQIKSEDLQNKFESERRKLVLEEADWNRERHTLQIRVEQLEMQIRLHESTPSMPSEHSPSPTPLDNRQSSEFKRIFGKSYCFQNSYKTVLNLCFEFSYQLFAYTR